VTAKGGPADAAARGGGLPRVAGRASELSMAVAMTAGRGRLARAVADIAGLGPADWVIDIGCGPGTAVREASRRAAGAIGVDPSPVMLRLARWMTAIRRTGEVSWRQGQAEKLPVPDGRASVAWAISSLHHWSDRPAGLGEARRALAPAGRLIVAERLVRRPAARGRGAHGLSPGQAEELSRELTAAGFLDVRVATRRAGRRNLVIVQGATAPA